MLGNPLRLLAEPLGLPTWLLTVVCFICLLYFIGRRNFDYFPKRNVPLNANLLPFLGNIVDFMMHGVSADIRRRERYGKVWGEMAGVTPVWVFAEPELIRQMAIKEFSHFINRRRQGFPVNKEFRKALTILEDSEWKGVRNVMSPTFSSAKMRKIVPLIQACADDFVDHIQHLYVEGKELEMKALSGCYTMDVIARTQFSIEAYDKKESREDSEIVKRAGKLFDSFNFFKRPLILLCFIVPNLYKLLEKFNYGILDGTTMEFFNRYLSNLYNYRQTLKTRPNDFLELMMEAHDIELDTKEDLQISAVDDTTETSQVIQDWRVGKKAMSKLEILSNALLFFLAGYETTATSMCWMFHVFAFYPDVQEKVYGEIIDTVDKYGSLTYEAVASMKYLDQVFCETTRMFPAAQRTDRVCKDTCTIGDYVIEKGNIVNFAIYAVHHDPEFWPDPEKFIPERFSPENRDRIVPYSYLTFGIGPRKCIAQRLATLETKIGVAEVVRRFRFVKSEHTEEYPPLKKMGMTVPVNGIKLRVESRQEETR